MHNARLAQLFTQHHGPSLLPLQWLKISHTVIFLDNGLVSYSPDQHQQKKKNLKKSIAGLNLVQKRSSASACCFPLTTLPQKTSFFVIWYWRSLLVLQPTLVTLCCQLFKPALWSTAEQVEERKILFSCSPDRLSALTVLKGTGSCGLRMRDCFRRRWQCWRSPLCCWAEGWRCRRRPGCCRAVWRAGPSPPAAAPPAPAAAPAAAASGAAGAERPTAPTSWSGPPPHAAHLTAETVTLQETRELGQNRGWQNVHRSGFQDSGLYRGSGLMRNGYKHLFLFKRINFKKGSSLSSIPLFHTCISIIIITWQTEHWLETVNVFYPLSGCNSWLFWNQLLKRLIN